jgi:hypothetical protein
MSSEPERPIEKVLRAYAKERSEQAGGAWELPPASRRLLQQEMARRFGQSQESDRGSLVWLVKLWSLRTAIAVSAIAVLALAVWLAIPSQKPKGNTALLAKNDQAAGSRTSREISPPQNDSLGLAPANPLNERDNAGQSFDKKVVKEREEVINNLRQESAAKDVNPTAEPESTQTEKGGETPANLAMAPAAVTKLGSSQPDRGNALVGGLLPQSAAPSALTTSAASTLAREKSQAVENGPTKSSVLLDQATMSAAPAQFSVTQPASPSKSPADRVVQYGYFASTQALGRQRRSFQQANQPKPSSYGLKTDAPSESLSGRVLSYFRVEQSGPELRVTDSDGSVYTGQLQSMLQAPPLGVAAADLQQKHETVQASPAATEPDKAAATTETRQQLEASGYVFQVIGTNRTSNQRVVFSGTLTGVMNVPGDVRAQNENTVTISRGTTPHSSQRQEDLWGGRSNLRLSGTAVIGQSQQFEINAVPVPPQQLTR